tara:strand:- start:346 stop:552 length:207 start_codon:yes stop_codon:yes gene_type:complete
MKDNRNILNSSYVVVSVDREGDVVNKKFFEFKTDKDAISYVKEKNHYKTRKESTNMYFAYKIKETEIL